MKGYHLVLILIFSLYFATNVVITNQSCASITPICNQEKYCQHCIRAHHCCVWCSDEDFQGYRCGTLNHTEFSKCNPSFISYNNETKAEIKLDPNFTDVQNDVSEAVQLRPKEYDLQLRIGEPINITIRYRPAKNFPLDLYYLMDLTKSMEPDLLTITGLGLNLTQLLETLTKNHRIAFGSYIDKPALPFYMTEEADFRNPCRIEGSVCEMGYLFKHRLNFTDNITQFTDEVTNSRVSANLDNLEGGMDALMQILLCGEKIGWNKISRKLVVVATDGEMHFAGDGLLSGSTKRNRKKCLIDSDGSYVASNLFDYPSLEEIHHELKNKKTNVIFAAKSTSYHYYKEMNGLIKEATFVGNLTENSTNILNLVGDGFYAFMRQVSLSVNTTTIPGLKVDFFADCDGNGQWRKTDTCNNAEENKVIDFTAQFLLTEPQDIESETVYIEESQIDEKVEVNIKFVGAKCNCPQMPSKKCNHGTSDCGNCICDDGWQGEDCSNTCENDVSKCRYVQDGIMSLSCSGRGDCICSKCACGFPFGGEFCQYECPIDISTRLICGGKGKCINGACQCEPTYNGTYCECSTLQDNCKIPGTDSLCNGNGECECNQCKCQTGYSGKFCEICDQCQGLCQHFEPCVIKSLEDNELNCTKEQDLVQVEIVKELKNREQNCLYRYDKEDQKCDAYFEYNIKNDRSVDVHVQEPQCYKPLSATMWGAIAFGVVLAMGLLALLVYKARNMYRDKIEYAKFMKDQESTFHSDQNPLYKSPVTSYMNPMEMSTLHQKHD